MLIDKFIKLRIIILIFAVLAVAGLGLTMYSNNVVYASITDVIRKVVGYPTYTAKIDFTNPQRLAYDVDKLSVGPDGARLLKKFDSADVVTLVPLEVEPGSTIVGFTEDAVKGQGSTITYQITSDYQNWWYFDGSEWKAAGSCEKCTNNAVEISKAIREFPITSDGIQIRAFLASQEKSVILYTVGLNINGRQKALSDAEAKELLFTRAVHAHTGHPPVSVCGNGVTEWGEECDDGNTANGDGCSAICKEEAPSCDGQTATIWVNGANKIVGGPDNGKTYNGTLNGTNGDDVMVGTAVRDKIYGKDGDDIICGLDGNDEINGGDDNDRIFSGPGNDEVTGYKGSDLICGSTGNDDIEGGSGNDRIDANGENNDKIDGGGNSDICLGGEDIDDCEDTTTPIPECGGAPAPVCGNGVLEEGEECDDSNTADGDGCSSQCLIEEGEEADCGNGVVETGEQCDDGNGDQNDYCNNQCLNQTPICHATSSETHPYNFLWVDDSAIDGEGANDHTQHPGDIIPITDIDGDGSFDDDDCNAYGQCGNGILDAGEQCDDGNLEDGDGCSGQCTLEVEWDKSSVEVDGHCEGANAAFTIINIAEPLIGDMTGASEYRVYRNDVLEQTGTFQLAGGEYIDVTVLSGGDSIRLEADQRPGHPGPSMESATVDGCYALIPPVATDDAANTLVNNAVVIDLLINDSDADGTLVPGSVTVASDPSNGNVVIDLSDGSATYTPDFGYYGLDAFVYQVCDNDGLCDTATVTIRILVPPTALGDSATTPMNTPVKIDVLANDTDTDGTLVPSSVNITTSPVNGSVIIDAGDGSLTYAPAAGYWGDEEIVYEVCDNDSLCDTATVTIKVLAPPNAIDDSASTAKNTPVDINILDNDSDPDGSLVFNSVSIEDDPDHGSVVYDSGSGIANYQPNTGFKGLDFFVYKVCDNDGLCDTAKVTIGVEAVLPPVANDDFANTKYQTEVVINVILNDTDADGSIVPSSVSIVTGPGNGAVTAHADGTITYKPFNGFSGNDSFVYSVCDDDGLCDPAIVYVTVNAPPTAVNDTATTPANTSVDINILDNDSDSDGTLDPASVVVISLPAHGDVVINSSTGLATYTPDTDYSGTDAFDYSVCDNDGDCDSATVTIYISVELIPPVAEDDSASTLVNNPVDINVLSNDYDIDGTLVPGTVRITVSPVSGNVTVNAVNGVITYDPNLGYTGTDTFKYEVCDNDDLCDSATVTVEVSSPSGGGQHSPIALDDNATTPYETPVDIAILNNDSDADGNLDATSVTILTSASHGVVSVDTGTGVASYAPNAGFWGTDTFVYQVCDTTFRCDNATVTVKVSAPPIAIDDSAVTDENSSVDVDILDNDRDPDGTLDPYTVAIVSDPGHGSVVYNPSTEMAVYTPNTNYTGIDTFVYRVCDRDGLCDTATVTIGVGALVPPVALNDTGVTGINARIDIAVLNNDFDIDGFLVPGTTVITGAPQNGQASVDANGVVTYTPNSGFAGIDTLTYQVCDNDGLCDSAIVDITVLSSEVPILPPTPGPSPILLVVPAAALPVPELGAISPAVSIYDEFCGDRVYTSPNITFVGSVPYSMGAISSLQFSYNGGLGWNDVNKTAGVGGSTVYNYTLSDLAPGNYSAMVRVVRTDGSVLSSEQCAFNIKGSLIFGANQFALTGNQAPLSDYGVIQFVVGEPQTLYLEGEGLSVVVIRVKETQKDFPMTYDPNLKLWVTPDLAFDEPGVYHLEAVSADTLGETYRRDINTVFVTEPSVIVGADNQETIPGAMATVYVRDPATGEFNPWNGEAFGQSNPFSVENGLATVLPSGEYYIRIEADGYAPAESLITFVNTKSIVTASAELSGGGGIIGRLLNAFTAGQTNNFPLIVSPLPEESLMPIGKVVPPISATNQSGKEVNFLAEPAGKPTVIFVYNYWNTKSQEQIRIFRKVSQQLGEKYGFVALTTEEPSSLNATQIKRGNYGVDIYKPDQQFFDDYKIISIPQVFVLNANNELLGTIVGSQSEQSLASKINEIAGL